MAERSFSQLPISSSHIGRRTGNTRRGIFPVSEYWIHAIPVIVFLCFFTLWIFSHSGSLFLRFFNLRKDFPEKMSLSDFGFGYSERHERWRDNVDTSSWEIHGREKRVSCQFSDSCFLCCFTSLLSSRRRRLYQSESHNFSQRNSIAAKCNPVGEQSKTATRSLISERRKVSFSFLLISFMNR